jgi:hypothetical protein
LRGISIAGVPAVGIADVQRAKNTMIKRVVEMMRIVMLSDIVEIDKIVEQYLEYNSPCVSG